MILLSAVPSPDEKGVVAVVSSARSGMPFWLQGLVYAVMTATITIGMAFLFSGPSREKTDRISNDVSSIICVLTVPPEDRTRKTLEDCGVDVEEVERSLGKKLFPATSSGGDAAQQQGQ